jgi:hypothetical protein
MLVPIEAAAQIWTAHPQSTEAIQATLVIVFVSTTTEVRFDKLAVQQKSTYIRRSSTRGCATWAKNICMSNNTALLK